MRIAAWCFKRRAVLEIALHLQLTMGACKETHAVISDLHKNGSTGKDIAASKVATKSTIYWIIRHLRERGPIVVKKDSGQECSLSARIMS